MSKQARAGYIRQEEHGREMTLPACYAAPDSVDQWRHDRMFSNLDPILRARPDATWLTVGDGACDFVLCKPAYHHSARPPEALYETLRLARMGVVLIEPIETSGCRPLPHSPWSASGGQHTNSLRDD